MTGPVWNPMAQQYQPKEAPMSSKTMTLADFLLARIAEDEATATGAQPAHWKADFVYVKPVDPDALPFSYVARLNGTVGEAWAEKRNATHIARWDPARVLAECQAKRQIVELHQDGMADVRWEG